MTGPIDVGGCCPMGCGMTLILSGQEWSGEGDVACSNPDCPRPDAVRMLLQNPETEHVVTIREGGFTVEHPLRERLDGALHQCELHQDLQAADGPPEKPGRYRVTRHEPDAVSESYRSGALGGWDFEAVS